MQRREPPPPQPTAGQSPLRPARAAAPAFSCLRGISGRACGYLTPSLAPSAGPTPVPLPRCKQCSQQRGAAPAAPSAGRWGEAAAAQRLSPRNYSRLQPSQRLPPRAAAAPLKPPPALLLGSFVRCTCSIGPPSQAPPKQETVWTTSGRPGPVRGAAHALEGRGGGGGAAASGPV